MCRTSYTRAGITEHGGHIVYKANVKQIVVEGGRATGVKLADGRVFRWGQHGGFQHFHSVYAECHQF